MRMWDIVCHKQLTASHPLGRRSISPNKVASFVFLTNAEKENPQPEQKVCRAGAV